jgi:FtsP/CotA-like multicopper oxidase with cupredoxin domain
MGGRAMSQMVQDAYDIVYAGEPEDEREVRWKWVLIGMKDVKNERDQAIARLGEAEKMIASTLADIMAHPWGLHDEPVETERDALIARLQQFLSRDSAGGKS